MQGATSGTIGPQGGDAVVIMGTNTVGTVRVDNFANVESWGNYAGPAFNPLLAFCREANVFDGQVQVFDTMFGANSMTESKQYHI